MKQPSKSRARFALRTLVISIAFAAVVVGCKRRELDGVGTDKTPLVFLLSPSHSAEAKHLQALSALVSKEAGLVVRVEVAPSQQAAIHRIRHKRADMALLSLFPYLFCHQEYGVNAGLRVLRDGGADTYTGEIVVPDASPVKTLADLSGKTIALANAYSVTGFILPAALLAENKVDARPVFAGTHAAALDMLRNSVADAAAIYSGGAGPGMRVIARTKAVPNEPVFFRAGLKPDLRQRLVAALERVSAAPEGKAILHKLANVQGFAKTSDADYRAAYAEIRAAGRQVPDMVKGGWDLYAAERLTAADFAP